MLFGVVESRWLFSWDVSLERKGSDLVAMIK